MKQSKTSLLYDKQKSISYYEDMFTRGYAEDRPLEKKQKTFEVIRGLELPDMGEVIDFGCGNGVLIDVIRQALPGWKVYGTDISRIAIDNAKKHHPSCTFFVTGDEKFANKKFDFLFTHHVLEHVYNLHQVIDEMVNYLKITSAMLHILPCGNEGSFEHSICLLRKDGINRELENRFFFEHEGHVRRLNTDQLNQLISDKGFVLAQEYYANQYYGAIEMISRSLRSVWKLTDVSLAIDKNAKRQLQKLRYYLSFISILRSINFRVENKWNKSEKTLKDYILLAVGLVPYIFTKPLDSYWKSKAREEWRTRKTEKNGSEMYLFFTRR